MRYVDQNDSANDRRLGVCKSFNGRKDYKYDSSEAKKDANLLTQNTWDPEAFTASK